MDPETLPTETQPTTPTTSRRPSRARRVLAVAAGVAMVPALYAVANAATGGGGGGGSATVAPASHSADDRGTELEIEHGVTVEKPHGGAATPSVPESTTPSVPGATAPTTPENEIEHGVENEVEHPVPEPGDDSGEDAPASVSDGTQSFSSVGGSITVAVNGGVLSLMSSSPAAGFGAEVHDNGPTRVEVRFTNGETEWRIRIDLGSGGLTQEISQHG
jgi:hypothetical protein